MTGPPESLPEYFRLVETVDTRGASDLVLGLLDEGAPLAAITGGVLAPAQVRVGQLWESGVWSVADEHAATQVTEAALTALTQAATAPRVPAPRHVAVACAEGEYHTLPARMAAAVASAGAARVTLLGPSTPAALLHRRLQAGDVDLVALSCTMATNLIGAARCIAAAHDLQIPVIAGGRAFGPDSARALALGADGWADDPQALLGPLPPLAGTIVEIPLEALLLDGVDDDLARLTHDRLLAAFPHLAAPDPPRPSLTRADLAGMARHAGAAVLTEDPSVLDDLLAWMCRPRHGQLPQVVAGAAGMLAEGLESQAPRGAFLLRTAAGRGAFDRPPTAET